MKFRKINILLYILSCLIIFAGCKNNQEISKKESQSQLKEILETQRLTPKQKFKIVDQMANNLFSENDYQGVILLLTDWVEENPDDIYNSYWLLYVANCYMQIKAEPMAEYYFDKILKSYPDLYIKGKSAHFLCLQNLIQISKISTYRIKYFTELINRFPQEVNTTELYYRLAKEYEKDNQWEQVLKTYKIFLQQPDASVVQIPGESDAYKVAKRIVDFSRSSKDWTFETLDDLEYSIKKAIKNHDWDRLDRIKAKVNFFSMSWKQDENDVIRDNISISAWVAGNELNIICGDRVEESSSPNEVYLRTSGWNGSVPVWYLYFRRIDFPINPEINGNWEWAGIYIGNRV